MRVEGSRSEAPPFADRLVRDSSLLHVFLDETSDVVFFKDRGVAISQSRRTSIPALGLESGADMVGKTDFDFFSVNSPKKSFAAEQEVARTG